MGAAPLSPEPQGRAYSPYSRPSHATRMVLRHHNAHGDAVEIVLGQSRSSRSSERLFGQHASTQSQMSSAAPSRAGSFERLRTARKASLQIRSASIVNRLTRGESPWEDRALERRQHRPSMDVIADSAESVYMPILAPLDDMVIRCLINARSSLGADRLSAGRRRAKLLTPHDNYQGWRQELQFCGLRS